jgi:hypothetical protein
MEMAQLLINRCAVHRMLRSSCQEKLSGKSAAQSFVFFTCNDDAQPSHPPQRIESYLM